MTAFRNEAASVEALGQVAQDYLKAIWSATEWGGNPATTKALALRFGITPAAVSDAIKRLTAQGLIDHAPYKSITLTERGEHLAIQMVRRHRLIETFLVEILDYDWTEVHHEAERLEHAASELLITRIDTLLDHPAHDPHGDPIPTKDGTVPRPENAIRLSDALPGRQQIVRVSDSESDRLDYFAQHGLVPGALITLIQHDTHARTVVLRTPSNEHLALAAPTSDAILVTRNP